MNITKFKKVFSALKFLDKPSKKGDKVKTLDIWKYDKDQLCFKGYDKTSTLEVKVSGTASSLFDTIVVDFSKFVKLISAVKTMPSFDHGADRGLQLQFEKRVINLSSARLFTFASWEPLYLSVDEILGTTWDTKALLEGLTYTSQCVSTDITRFHLNTVLFAEDGNMIATDGHRLHKYEYPTKPSDGRRFLLPLKAVNILKTSIKVCGGNSAIVKSVRSEELIQYTVEGKGLHFKLTSEIVDANFPRHDAVIPKTWESRCEANTMQFREAAALIAKLSDSNMQTVEFKMDQVLSLRGDGVEEIISATDIEGPGFQFGVCGANGEYLKQSTNLPGDSLVVEFGEPLDPVVIKQGRFLAVVMPQRI